MRETPRSNDDLPKVSNIIVHSPKLVTNKGTKKHDKKVVFSNPPVNNEEAHNNDDNNSLLGKSEDHLIGHKPAVNILDEIIVTPIKEDTHPVNHSISYPRTLNNFFDDSNEDSNMRSSVHYTDPGHRGSPHVDSLKSQITLGMPEVQKKPKKSCCKKRKPTLKRGNITLMGDQIIQRKSGQKFRDNKSSSENKLLNIIAKIAVQGKNRSIRTIFKKALLRKNPEAIDKAKKRFMQKNQNKLKKFRKNVYEFILKLSVPFLPDTMWMAAWKSLIVLAILCSIIVSSFSAAFLNESDISLQTSNLTRLAFAADIIYLVDIMMTFHTSYYYRGELRNNTRDIFLNYVRSFNFYIDLVSVLGLVFLFLNGRVFQSLLIFNMLRIYKLPILFGSIQDYFQFGRKATSVIQLLKLFFVIIVSAHLFGCLMYSLTYIREDNWVNRSEKQLYRLHLYEIYIASLYWSVATMATVGYGDITPYNEIERLVTIVIMCISSIIFGYTLSSIGAIIMEMSKFSSESREKIRLVTKYMTDKGLTKDFQVRIQKYLEFYLDKENGTKMEGTEILQFLSDNLKDEIIREVNAKLLDKCDLFYSNFRKKFIYEISKCLQEKSLGPDEFIFMHNDDNDKSIYFIANGKVDICYEKCNTSIQKIDVNKAYFGEIAFFSGNPRSASAKTLEFTTLFYLTRETFLSKLTEYPIENETFKMIYDSLTIYKSFQYLNLLCYSCGKDNHLALQCKNIHPKINKKAIIKNFIKQEEEYRKNFERKDPKRRFHAKRDLDNIQEAATRIQLQYEQEIDQGEIREFEEDDSVEYSDTDEVFERCVFSPPSVTYSDEEGVIKTWYPFEKSKRGTIRFVDRKRDKVKSEIEQSIKRNYDYFYRNVSIDKVHNFEVYYPNNNITRLMAQFDRVRVELILNRRLGVKATPISTLLVKGFKMSSVARNRNETETKDKVHKELKRKTTGQLSNEPLIPNMSNMEVNNPNNVANKRRYSANPDQIALYGNMVNLGSGSELDTSMKAPPFLGSKGSARKSLSASNLPLLAGHFAGPSSKPNLSSFKPSYGDVDGELVYKGTEGEIPKLSASKIESEVSSSDDESLQERSQHVKSTSGVKSSTGTKGRLDSGEVQTEDINELKKTNKLVYDDYRISNKTDSTVMFSDKMLKVTGKFEENYGAKSPSPDKHRDKVFTFFKEKSMSNTKDTTEAEIIGDFLKDKKRADLINGIKRSNSSDNIREAKQVINKWGLRNTLLKKKK